MSGLGPDIVVHQLATNPKAKLVIQLRRKFSPEAEKQIAAEINKLLVAKFIREVEYLDCTVNAVLVKEKNGQIKVCVDF